MSSYSVTFPLNYTLTVSAVPFTSLDESRTLIEYIKLLEELITKLHEMPTQSCIIYTLWIMRSLRVLCDTPVPDDTINKMYTILENSLSKKEELYNLYYIGPVILDLVKVIHSIIILTD